MKVHTELVVYRNLEMPEVPVYTVKAHKEIVNSIDGVGGLGIGDGAPEIVTGSRDGKNIHPSKKNFFKAMTKTS